MRETLRLSPTAPARTVVPLEDVVLTGTSPRNGSSAPRKYKIEKDTVIAIHFPAVQRDPAVYGSDAEEFRPERMMDEKFEKLPQGAWTPFGYGMRACIVSFSYTLSVYSQLRCFFFVGTSLRLARSTTGFSSRLPLLRCLLRRPRLRIATQASVDHQA